MSLAYSTMLAYNAPFCGGMGTSNEPYLICTPEGLMEIKNNLNSYYKLKNDIDLQNIKWIPIGNEAHPFEGNLDGDGYKILNLKLNTDERFSGLFGVSEGTISNLDLINVNVTGGQETSSLVGRNLGLIKEIYVTGDIKGSSFVGGLVGSNGGIIENSRTDVYINGREYIGGLVGYNNGVYKNEGIIRNCSSTGKSYGRDNIGGLIGFDNKGKEISNSYSINLVEGNDRVGGLIGSTIQSNILDSYFIGKVQGKNFVGGLIGETGLTSIKKSYSNSEVIGKRYVGVLVGSFSGGIIENSYSNGYAKGDDNVGGLVGSTNGGTIINCYTYANVNNYETYGLFGKSYLDTKIKNSFYDKGIISQIKENEWSKTTEEMKDIKTYSNVGWDIKYTNIDKNNGYPFLAWEENIEGVWLIYDSRVNVVDEYNQKIELADWNYILLGIGVLVVLIVIFVIGIKYLKNK